MNETGGVPEYQMVGLGADYARFFSIASSAYYKGTGFNIGADVKQSHGQGLQFSGGYQYRPYDRILTDLNALPLTTLYLKRLHGELEWKAAGQVEWSVFAGTDYEKRTGDEQIAGNSSASEYRILGKLTMYHAHNASYYGGGCVSRAQNRNRWSAELKGGWIDFAEHYIYPVRKLSFGKFFADLQTQWIHSFRNNGLLTCGIDSRYYANSQKDITMPYALMDELNTDLVGHTFDSSTANYGTAGFDVRYDHPIKSSGRYGVFATLSGHWTGNGNYHETDLNMAVGMTF
ncbi:MAG: hypothetical protein LUC45_02325 [Paraprevotella sp.]|nr:hypothetical protein [Paraprevotella sp.]